jgi:hypothetical protein
MLAFGISQLSSKRNTFEGMMRPSAVPSPYPDITAIHGREPFGCATDEVCYQKVALLNLSMAVRPTAFCSSPYKNADAAKNADAGASAFLRRA